MSIHLAQYASSDGARMYTITRGSDNVVYCDCQGWKMRRNCKHLLDFSANGGQGAIKLLYQTTTLEPIIAEAHVEDQSIDSALQTAIKMMKGN